MARFALRGNLEIVKVTTAPTDLTAATTAEVTAGDSMLGVEAAEALAGMSGWETSPSTINTPDLLSLETGNIPGETTFGTAELQYYTDDTANAIWDAEVEGETGYFLFFPSGTGSGKAYTLFQVSVLNRTRMLASGNEAEKHKIQYSIAQRVEGEQAA